MGAYADRIIGRAKQAVGALTGNKATKREGERQERKGEVKGHIDDAAEKAQDAAEQPQGQAQGCRRQGVIRRARCLSAETRCLAGGARRREILSRRQGHDMGARRARTSQRSDVDGAARPPEVVLREGACRRRPAVRRVTAPRGGRYGVLVVFADARLALALVLVLWKT